jgi:DNA-binding NtrC family response regulator
VVADAERQAILAALQAAGGRKSQAAQLLGISRATLYEKLSQLKMAA